MMHTKQQRETHFDALRGIAALLVTINHFFAAFYPYTVFGSKASYSPSAFESLFHMPPLGIFVAGPFDVSLFFILSGYVLSYSHIGNASATKLIAAIIKRPFRLGGLVLITVAISAVLWHFGLFYNQKFIELTHSNQWFSSFWINSFNLETLLQNLTFNLFSASSIYNPPLWTIDLELKGSLLIFISLLFFGNHRHRLWLMIILVLVTKGSCYSGFILGMIFADLQKNYFLSQTLAQLPKSKWIALTLLFIFFVIFSSYPSYIDASFLEHTAYKWLPNTQRLRIIYPMLGALSLFLIVLLSARVKSILNLSVLKFLGDISFSVYVIHFLVLGSFSSWLFIQLYGVFNYGVAFILVSTSGIFITILTAWAMTKWMDLPIIALSNFIDKSVQKLISKSPTISSFLSTWEKIAKHFPHKPNQKVLE